MKAIDKVIEQNTMLVNALIDSQKMMTRCIDKMAGVIVTPDNEQLQRIMSEHENGVEPGEGLSIRRMPLPEPPPPDYTGEVTAEWAGGPG